MGSGCGDSIVERCFYKNLIIHPFNVIICMMITNKIADTLNNVVLKTKL